MITATATAIVAATDGRIDAISFANTRHTTKFDQANKLGQTANVSFGPMYIIIRFITKYPGRIVNDPTF
jgi:hypothetical protein